jgi:tRNA pseudouridine38-40 synthase
MRYFLYLSYNGTAYHGWQTQPNTPSVQETLEKCLSVLVAEDIAVTGAGRTDTGVHAEMMTAHFDVETPIDTAVLTKKLNSFLPNDIAVQKIIQVKDDLHARFDAVSRTYEYRITLQKNPFLQDLACRFHGELDFKRMNEAAETLFDYTDFTSFSKLHTDTKTNNCRIMQAEWLQRGDVWVFHIQADRFLRNMVRAIVGTLLEVGKGKITIEKFRQIIEEKNRCAAGTSVPACGLYLVDVEYNISTSKELL